jgi:epoxyqueuosine reductase
MGFRPFEGFTAGGSGRLARRPDPIPSRPQHLPRRTPAAVASVLRPARLLMRPVTEAVARMIEPLARRAVVSERGTVWRFWPSVPTVLRPMTAPVKGWWPQQRFVVPEALRSYAGARQNPEYGNAAYRENPLKVWTHQYAGATVDMYQSIWRSQFPALPGYQRAIRACREASRRTPAAPARHRTPAELTSRLKAFAARTGLNAVGIAEYEQRFRLEDYPLKHEEEGNHRVLVCVLEEHYASMQTLPSARHDRATMNCIVELMKMQTEIVTYLQSEGYRAHAHDDEGGAVAIPYAVAAGLGQLGLNGVLLTPFAGPRVRLGLISTNAPVIVDQPVDFGIPKICDSCRSCVRNCPARALSARRRSFRGIEKAKVNASRCAPVLSIAHDCGVCQKTCPVHRYGLQAVHEEFKRTGNILGAGTDELEGYTWVDGSYYGPRQRPKPGKETFELPIYAAIDPPHPDPNNPLEDAG